MKLIAPVKTPLLVWGIKAALLLCLVTPLLVSSKFIFPFITTKTLWFRILVELAAAGCVIAVLQYPRYRPSLSLFLKSILAYASIALVASLFGLNWQRSFWGNIERGEGLITLFHVFAYCVALVAVLKERREWEFFLATSLSVAGIASLYALAQYLLLPWEFILKSGGSRLSATVGNASFLAGYLLMHTFIAAWFAVTPRSFIMRVYAALLFLFLWFIIYHTGTRGALIAGFITYLCIMLFSLTVIKGGRARIYRVVICLFIATLIACAAVIYQQRDQKWVYENPTLSRLVSISFKNDITTQSRVLTWQSSWKALQERPVLGYGYENYNVAFNKHFDARIYRDAGSQIWFDRAHNLIFDIAITSGVIGLIAFGFIFFSLFIGAWKLYRHHDPVFRVSGVMFGSLLVAHLMQALFVFDILATYIPLMLAMGFVHFMSQEQPHGLSALLPSHHAGPRVPIASVSLIVCAVFGIMLYGFNVKPALANHYGLQGMRLRANNHDRDAFFQYKKALSYDTYQSQEIRQKLAEFAIEIRSGSSQMSDEEIAEVYKTAIDEILHNIEEAPQDTQAYMYLMNLYYYGSRFNKDRLQLIDKAGEEALKLSPTRPQIYYLLGQAAAEREEYNVAVQYFEKALALNPEVFESHWNLAVAYRIAGRKEAEAAQYKVLESKGLAFERIKSLDEQNLLRLAQAYTSLQEYEKMAGTYEELVIRQPNNYDYNAHWATALRLGKQFENARMVARRLIELRPSGKDDIEKFINEMEQEERAQTQ